MEKYFIIIHCEKKLQEIMVLCRKIQTLGSV